jgi:uncharacterized protein
MTVLEPTISILLAGLIATFLMSVSKAGFGGGLGALATPIMALTMTAPQAVAVMLPLLLVMDAMGLWTFRKTFDASVLKIILPGAMVGTLLGWALFELVDPRWIKAILAIECLLFAALRLRKNTEIQTKKEAKVIPGLFFGAMSSFASFISHAGSPPILQYTLPLKIEKTVFVGTMTVFFTFVNLSKLVPYGQLNLLNFHHLKVSLWLAPIIPFGFFVGLKLLKTMDQARFNQIITAAMFVTGLKLLWDVFF